MAIILDIPYSTPRLRGFSADLAAHHFRRDREDGVQGSCLRSLGRSPHTYRTREAEVRDPSLTVGRVVRMPWVEEYRAWGWEEPCQFGLVLLSLKGTHWPRGQSGPIGQNPVRYN